MTLGNFDFRHNTQLGKESNLTLDQRNIVSRNCLSRFQIPCGCKEGGSGGSSLSFRTFLKAAGTSNNAGSNGFVESSTTSVFAVSVQGPGVPSGSNVRFRDVISTAKPRSPHVHPGLMNDDAVHLRLFASTIGGDRANPDAMFARQTKTAIVHVQIDIPTVLFAFVALRNSFRARNLLLANDEVAGGEAEHLLAFARVNGLDGNAERSAGRFDPVRLHACREA